MPSIQYVVPAWTYQNGAVDIGRPEIFWGFFHFCDGNGVGGYTGLPRAREETGE